MTALQTLERFLAEEFQGTLSPSPTSPCARFEFRITHLQSNTTQDAIEAKVIEFYHKRNFIQKGKVLFFTHKDGGIESACVTYSKSEDTLLVGYQKLR